MNIYICYRYDPGDSLPSWWRDKIRHELNRRGWTQRETAKRLGVSQAYLSMMLSGQRPLSPRIAVRLESVTGLIAWHLLFYQMQEDVALAYREETAWLNADLAETADE